MFVIGNIGLVVRFVIVKAPLVIEQADVVIWVQAFAQVRLPDVNPKLEHVKKPKLLLSQASPDSTMLFPQTGGTVQSTGQLAFVSVGGSQMLFPQTGGLLVHDAVEI